MWMTLCLNFEYFDCSRMDFYDIFNAKSYIDNFLEKSVDILSQISTKKPCKLSKLVKCEISK